MTVFDIETGPLDSEWVLSMCEPFPPYAKPAPFDPGWVKTGNLKDQTKIRAKIEEAEQRYAEECLQSYPNWLREKEVYEASRLDEASKNAHTGRVLAVGYGAMIGDRTYIDITADEATMLATLWDNVAHEMLEWRGGMIGFFINGFDLPFCVRRSLVLGVPVPTGLIDKNRFWHPKMIDLHELWALGRGDRISLDALSRLMGGKGKNGDGAQFHRLINGTTEERDQAVSYLLNDVVITRDIARKMGIGKAVT